mgnify:CR=1 FL=1
MKVNLKQLMEHLGVAYVLGSYQADMHQHYDEENALTCSAEARMGPEQTELECEIQIFHDIPPEGKPPVEQIMAMKARPKQDGNWSPFLLLVKGEDITDKFGGWAEGACAFYNAATMHLKREEMPDLDALIDEHLQGEGGKAGRGRRGGGRKNPKFKPPQNTMNMKQGM